MHHRPAETSGFPRGYFARRDAPESLSTSGCQFLSTRVQTEWDTHKGHHAFRMQYPITLYMPLKCHYVTDSLAVNLYLPLECQLFAKNLLSQQKKGEPPK
eukprot:178298-Amphidinium_carterae.1